MALTSTPATAMRYRDVAVAADWLCSAFGFEKQTVLRGSDGSPVYVQLTFGRAMLMLAPVRATAIDKLMKQPDEIDGAETQSGYYVVTDADAHYAQAKASGATIILDVEDDDFGGRAYTCRDPEGHIWTFGTYDPWQGKFPEPELPPPVPPASGGLRRVLMMMLSLVVIAGVGVAGWYGGVLTQSSAVSSVAPVPPREMQGGSKALAAAEKAALNALGQLERESAARAQADQAREDALKRAGDERQSREAAERAASEARAELEKVRADKSASSAAAGAEAAKRIEQEKSGREAAERAVKEARAELERERATKAAATAGNAEILKRVEQEKSAREAAERTVKEARAELEKVKADKVAAEMAKEFALGRAEEEQLGREAAEKAAEEARAELEKRSGAAPAEMKASVDPAILKGVPDMQRSVEEASKRAADAERAVKEARAELAKEQASKNAAWKVVGQLTKQLKQYEANAAASGEASSGDDGSQPAKKARAKLKKKAAED